MKEPPSGGFFVDAEAARFDAEAARFDVGAARFDVGAARFDVGAARFDVGAARPVSRKPAPVLGFWHFTNKEHVPNKEHVGQPTLLGVV